MRQTPIISLVVAVADNGVIGSVGDLPWRLPDDLKHFKALTVGHTIVMGRRTFESIGKPLPDRRSIVVTRQLNYEVEGADVVSSVDAAIESARGESELFIIGGRSIYETALPRTDRIHLTRVHGKPAGDVYFPNFNLSQWQVTNEPHHPVDEKHDYAMTFQRWDRVASTKQD